MADAFDTDGDESDDDADDRQRLVRRSSAQTPASSSASQTSTHDIPSGQPSPVPQIGVDASSTPFRVYGGGIQSDGVFSNLAAKPELEGDGKEEQPPVSFQFNSKQDSADHSRHTNKPPPMQLPRTGRPPFLHQASADQTKCTLMACRLAPSFHLFGMP